MSDSHGHSDDHSHGGGFSTYMTVFAALVVLTASSFWLGNSSIKETSPGVVWAGMMAISCGKAMLVILFFMHLLWEANWKYILTIPSMMMSVFLVCMLIPDVGMRTRKYTDERIWRAASMAAKEESHADAHGVGHDHADGEAHTESGAAH